MWTVRDCLLCVDETRCPTSPHTQPPWRAARAGACLPGRGSLTLALGNITMGCPFFMGSLPHIFIFPNLLGVGR